MKKLFLFFALSAAVLSYGEKWIFASPWISVPDMGVRSFWDQKKTTPFGVQLLKNAETALKTTAKIPDEASYLDYSRTGNRSRYERTYMAIIRNYENLTLALALTADKTKYLPQWQAYNDVLCKMPTWILPAHDKNLQNYKQQYRRIELVSVRVAAIMANARILLKPCLTPAELTAMDQAVKRHILTPYFDTIAGTHPKDTFLLTKNNWNPVCISNIIQIILAGDLTIEQRQTAVDYALKHLSKYLRGFTVDGYCTEGIAYWDYGFGHYLRLNGLLFSASHGKVNLLDDPAAKLIAGFPERFALSLNRFFPPFSDTPFNGKVSQEVIYLRDYFCDRFTGNPDAMLNANPQYQQIIWGLPRPVERKKEFSAQEKISSFPKTGVFIFRHPEKTGLIFACKGGSNNEFHNHNDVGSYSIAFSGEMPILGDVGKPPYNKDSFTSKRYNNPILNSYGHPVPVIGGALQNYGNNTQSQIVRFDHSDSFGEVVLNLRPAYSRTPGINLLERKFRYEFGGNGKVIITDRANFSDPRTFEVPLITFGKITKISDTKLTAEYLNSQVNITINTFGIPYSLKTETLKTQTSLKIPPKRYAIVLKGKHLSPKIEITVTPL